MLSTLEKAAQQLNRFVQDLAKLFVQCFRVVFFKLAVSLLKKSKKFDFCTPYAKH